MNESVGENWCRRRTPDKVTILTFFEHTLTDSAVMIAILLLVWTILKVWLVCGLCLVLFIALVGEREQQ